jgi:hypothetical protein
MGLVSIPRLDDRLGLFAGGEKFDGFLQRVAHDRPRESLTTARKNT